MHCLCLKVAEWNKLFLQRQQDWMSVFFSKTDMDIGEIKISVWKLLAVIAQF